MVALIGPSDLHAGSEECDADRGRKLYAQCSICHGSLDSPASSTGPTLAGVVGRPVGKLADFKFSPALRNAGGEWTVEGLQEFLSNPSQQIPGVRMAFAGIPSIEDRSALVCFLALSPIESE